jgi:hypothetical protein
VGKQAAVMFCGFASAIAETRPPFQLNTLKAETQKVVVALILNLLPSDLQKRAKAIIGYTAFGVI